jgi:hypothetical protein
MRDKVTFATNVPQEVVLAFDEGKEINGQFGDSVMYTLEGERVMFVPPIVRDRLDKLGVGRGEPVIICKAEVVNGTRRRVEWKVERGEASESLATALAPRASSAPVPVLVPASAQPKPSTPALQNGNGHALAPAAPAESLLESCLVQAMIAAMRAEKAGQGIGCTLRFNSEDVRAMALTLYIQTARGGAR